MQKTLKKIGGRQVKGFLKNIEETKSEWKLKNII